MIKIVFFLSLFVCNADANNRANQMNPNNSAYWQSRGYESRPQNWDRQTNHATNNRANQLNPNNTAYWKSRGYKRRPSDWNRRANNSYDNNRANQLNPNNSSYIAVRKPFNTARAHATNLKRSRVRNQKLYQNSLKASHATQPQELASRAHLKQVAKKTASERSNDERDELPLSPLGYLICGTILFAANYRDYFG